MSNGVMRFWIGKQFLIHFFIAFLGNCLVLGGGNIQALTSCKSFIWVRIKGGSRGYPGKTWLWDQCISGHRTHTHTHGTTGTSYLAQSTVYWYTFGKTPEKRNAALNADRGKFKWLQHRSCKINEAQTTRLYWGFWKLFNSRLYSPRCPKALKPVSIQILNSCSCVTQMSLRWKSLAWNSKRERSEPKFKSSRVVVCCDWKQGANAETV